MSSQFNVIALIAAVTFAIFSFSNQAKAQFNYDVQDTTAMSHTARQSTVPTTQVPPSYPQQSYTIGIEAVELGNSLKSFVYFQARRLQDYCLNRATESFRSTVRTSTTPTNYEPF